MTGSLAVLALGSALWGAAHAWCHARCAALEAGDREGLSAPGARERLSGPLGDGIRARTVSPAVAEESLAAGVIAEDLASMTRTGRYRRLYDRTALTDLAWLPAFIAAAAAGWASSPAMSANLCLAVWAAMADVRFRAVPVPCAALLALTAVAACPAGPVAGLLALAPTSAALLALRGAALAASSEFGSGDVVLLACALTALWEPRRWLAFAAALMASLIAHLIASATRNRVSGRERDGSLVPLGAFTCPALALAAALP